MAELYENDVYSTLTATIAAGDLTLTVASATGFPATGTFAVRVDDEIMTVTSVSGTTFTVTRASEAVAGVTAAAAHTAGAEVHLVLTKRSLAAIAAAAGVTDHGGLTGLADDDHAQYALLAGRSLGQTLVGGTASGEDLTLQSTAHATKGSIIFGTSSYDEVNNWLGLGVTPTTTLQVQGPALFTPQSVATNLWLLNASTTAFDGATNYFNIQRSGTSRFALSSFAGNAVAAGGLKISTGGSNNSLAFDAIGAGGLGAMMFAVNASPVLYFSNGSGNSWISKFLGIHTGRTTLVAQSMAAQTASVQEWWDSSSNVLGSITPTGLTTHTLFDSATNAVSNVLVIGHNTSGTPDNGLGNALVFAIESSTTPDTTAGKITCRWGEKTHASREGILALYATDYNGDRLGIEITGNGSATEMGLFGVTPVTRPTAFTQTYSTATKTHAAPTAAALTVTDGAGTNDGTIGAITADASVIAAVQELADQINKLIVDVANVKQVVNSVIDDGQALGNLQ